MLQNIIEKYVAKHSLLIIAIQLYYGRTDVVYWALIILQLDLV